MDPVLPVAQVLPQGLYEAELQPGGVRDLGLVVCLLRGRSLKKGKDLFLMVPVRLRKQE